MERTSSAPVPSMKFFREYCAVLLEMRDWAAQPPSTEPEEEEIAETETPAAPSPMGNGALAALAAATAAATAAPVAKRGLARPRIIWNRLALLLDQQLMEASRIAGPVGMEFHREAVYVMSALTDEMFVHLRWEGQEFWLSHLLEARFFQTHFAGEQFFRRMDDLLSRDDDPAGELAGVYLTALALGFRGRYWDAKSSDILDRYRKRLFLLMTRRDPELGEPRPQLFPDAYRNAIRSAAIHRMPATRRWLIVLVCLFCLWMLATNLIWYDLSSEIKRRLCCLSPNCSMNCPASSGGAAQ